MPRFSSIMPGFILRTYAVERFFGSTAPEKSLNCVIPGPDLDSFRCIGSTVATERSWVLDDFDFFPVLSLLLQIIRKSGISGIGNFSLG